MKGEQLTLKLNSVQHKPKPNMGHVLDLIGDGQNYKCLTRPGRPSNLIESVKHKIDTGQSDDIRFEEAVMLHALNELVKEEKGKEEKGDRSYLFRDNRHFEGANHTQDLVKYFKKLDELKGEDVSTLLEELRLAISPQS